MRKILIEGGKKLGGNVKISGSKNASMPIMISTILTSGDNHLRNVPDVSDTANTVALLRYLGCSVEMEQKSSERIFHINSGKVNAFDPPKDIVSQFRASFWVLGPLLARYGECKIPMPGGCSIGARPVDIYLETLPKMGVEIKEENGYVNAKAIDRRLRGASITLRLPSVGVTHTLMMAGTLAEGKTVIRNAAREPEVVELGNFLIRAGAEIEGLGTDIIRIEGVRKLNGSSYTIMADRIEAFSYIISGLITDGELTLNGAKFFDILGNPLNTLSAMGAKITKIDDCTIGVVGNKAIMKGVDITTGFYPEFPTDCQPIIMPLLTLINSKSSLNETIYESRFKHIGELVKMGANIRLNENNVAHIGGALNSLWGTKVLASDLRAGMGLVLAALAAKGKTIIENVEHIERGYENLVGKLESVGANINVIE